jgi:hypothetical protein
MKVLDESDKVDELHSMGQAFTERSTALSLNLDQIIKRID